MTLLEQKVDAIARGLLANDVTDRNAALAELEVLMQKPYNSADGVESVTRQLLIELGIPENVRGSRYLIKAIELVMQDSGLMDSMTKGLLPAIGQCFDRSWQSVEHAIRHAIQRVFERGDREVLYRYFGGTVSTCTGSPTNAEFIARCANVVRERMGGA